MAGNIVRSLGLSLCLALLASGCSATLPNLRGYAPTPVSRSAMISTPAASVKPSSLDGLIDKYAALYDVPEALIRRIIVRESGYNPKARNGPYYGLMQIRYDTAQSMGYRGPASGLLDADTNLRYGVKYLAGAYLVGRNNSDQAVRNYSRGYYYDAKRMGLLEEVGLR